MTMVIVRPVRFSRTSSVAGWTVAAAGAGVAGVAVLGGDVAGGVGCTACACAAVAGIIAEAMARTEASKR
jgi:hypothetical protein